MKKNCNSAPLTVYDESQTWGLSEVHHLYRRAAFGISPKDAKSILAKTPEEAVDDLVDAAINKRPTAKPPWADNHTDSDQMNKELKEEWRHVMLLELKNNGLRDRLMLFWSNHFVTEYSSHNCPSYWYGYINALQRNCLGNLKTFVHEIGLTSAMLKYLNGNQNVSKSPNENYARELYELFTLGEGIGYTQRDIEETAKALTGYTTRPDKCAPITFTPEDFNTEEKTIFGRKGNWGYDDVIDILFEERPKEIAEFIVRKIYRYFVHPVLPAKSILDELAVDLVDADFELAPVIRKLLKSQHFFDSSARSVIIKSPIDLVVSIYNECMMPFPEFGVDFVGRALYYWAQNMGQQFFNPPNVAGWEGDQKWINSSLLLNRWQFTEKIIRRLFDAYDQELFRNLAIAITDDPAEDDVEVICRKIVETFLPKSLLGPADYRNALETFKSNVPSNFFEDGTWTLLHPTVLTQMRDLLVHLVYQPEYQLK